MCRILRELPSRSWSSLPVASLRGDNWRVCAAWVAVISMMITCSAGGGSRGRHRAHTKMFDAVPHSPTARPVYRQLSRRHVTPAAIQTRTSFRARTMTGQAAICTIVAFLRPMAAYPLFPCPLSPLLPRTSADVARFRGARFPLPARKKRLGSAIRGAWDFRHLRDPKRGTFLLYNSRKVQSWWAGNTEFRGESMIEYM